MTVLVFGKTGQVATELQAQGAVLALGRAEADLSDPAACAAAVLAHAPSAVINAAAYTAVDQAEDDEALATAINGDAPTAMARACAQLGIPMVQISTDYVFSGAGDRPWKPDDPVAPLGAYGRSKLNGELGVQSAGCPYAILRTSWVVSAHGANFVKTMLRLATEREGLGIVADQFGGPTPARQIAQACLRIAQTLRAEPSASGVYHFSGAPDVSWADFAREIFAQAGLTCAVEDIATSDYPTKAQRPLNSRLDCQATEAAFGLTRPDWRDGLSEILRDLDAA